MAKTWTLKEAYEAMKANDVNAIADFGKRFPIATAALAKSGANDGLNTLFGAMPDRVTMRTLEMVLKEGVSEVEDDEAEETAPVEKPKKEKKQTEKKADKAEKKAEKPVKAKKVEKAETEDEEVAEETADAKEDYSSMGAVELFKLCKKRGIKVEPKQKANVYIKALEAADAEAESSDEEDDDWSDDEDEKPAKGKAKKAEKKSKKSDDDDDSDWDI